MNTILKKDQAHVWHPFTQVQTASSPLCIVSAKDATLTDIDGKTYIDCNSAWWTIVHGHANEHIGNALKKQFSTLDHIVFAGITHPKAVEVAERIVQLLPDNFNKVFFSDNGSTSTEVAIKMAHQYWYNQSKTKSKFMAIRGAYHGDTFGAMSVGERSMFNAPFEHLFFEVEYLPFPTDDNWREVLEYAETHFKTGDFAGFIFEPLVQGASGMRMYKKEWLNALVKLAQKYNVITIADEVMTGFYRTGTMFAIDQIEAKPDIICMSKGITGGVLPIGLTVTTDAIHDSFLSNDFAKGFLHGHSFTGNPISCAAVAASLDIFEKEETIQNIKQLCDWQTKYYHQFKNHPKLKEVRLTGTIFVMEVKVGEESSYFSSVKEKAYQFFIENGLLIRPLGNVIFINPPYCITEAEIEYTYQKVKEFLDAL